MNTRIDFKDRGIVNVYGDMAEDCVDALSSFYDEMETLCRTHSYRPMVIFTNNVQRFYAEDFRNHVMACFEQWENSEFSIPALARSVRAGAGAETTARGFMADLQERLERMFTRSFVPIRVDEDAPALDAQDIEKINDHIDAFRMRAIQAKDNALSIASAKSLENMLYSLISPVLKNTGESLCECFDSMLKAVLEGTELYKAGVGRTLENIVTGSTIDPVKLVSWPAEEAFL